MRSWLTSCANCDRVKKATKNPEYIKLRQTVIDKLGGRCQWCGENRLGALDIDHVNGNGPAHRRELLMLGYKEDYAIYRWLIDNNFTCSYNLQLLCRACHRAKHKGGKYKIIMRNGVRCDLGGYALDTRI